MADSVVPSMLDRRIVAKAVVVAHAVAVDASSKDGDAKDAPSAREASGLQCDFNHDIVFGACIRGRGSP
jgi:hypothetical protein